MTMVGRSADSLPCPAPPRLMMSPWSSSNHKFAANRRNANPQFVVTATVSKKIQIIDELRNIPARFSLGAGILQSTGLNKTR